MTASTQPGTADPAAHATTIQVVVGRYPYRPACTCGQAFRGYVARHAAEAIAEAHEREMAHA